MVSLRRLACIGEKGGTYQSRERQRPERRQGHFECLEAGGGVVLLTEPGETGMVSLLSAPPFLLRCTPPPQLQAHAFLIIPYRDAVRTDERENGEDPFPEANLSYLCCHSCYDFILESVFLGPSKVG